MNKKAIGGLSPHEIDMLAYLRRYIEKHVAAPTYEEICKELDYKSKSGVSRVMGQLEEHGFIKRVPRRLRAIEITPSGMGVRLPEGS